MFRSENFNSNKLIIIELLIDNYTKPTNTTSWMYWIRFHLHCNYFPCQQIREQITNFKTTKIFHNFVWFGCVRVSSLYHWIGIIGLDHWIGTLLELPLIGCQCEAVKSSLSLSTSPK